MTPIRIQSLKAIQILDSRGLPTIQVTISATNPTDPIDNKAILPKVQYQVVLQLVNGKLWNFEIRIQ